jgi:uncharacterized membrane protein YedE/YeeE
MMPVAPFFELGAFGAFGSQVAAVAIGIAFGVALERAGLGHAPKLAAQFYATDFTVLKVMLSAIVTAMLGVFWLARLDVLDLTLVAVPETWVLPQLVGGLLFGAGFVVSGLCPGTACVSAATGRGDGAAAVLGFFVGILIAGLAFESLRSFYDSTARGVWTLDQWSGLSYGVVVAGVVAMALLAFVVAERVEARA